MKRSEIEKLVDMKEAIDSVEKAFRKYSEGKVIYPPKMQMTPNEDAKTWWGFMPCYVDEVGLGIKAVSDYEDNKGKGLPTISAVYVLLDEKSGQAKAIMDANYLTALRTGALGGIAAKYLSREDAATVGVFGCGTQAKTQLEGVCAVRRITEALVVDKSKEYAERFKEEMSKKLGITIKIAKPEQAAGCDIVIGATTSRTPVILGKWVKEGAHVTSIGAHTPDAREVDDELVKRAKVVVDCPDAFKSGDIIKVAQVETASIKDIIAGKKKVRQSDSDITLFKTSGTAIQDVAVASLVFNKAKASGVGKELDLSR